jgi:hypothetical protein
MLASVKVLIVEDEPLIGMGMDQIVRSAGADAVLLPSLAEVSAITGGLEQFGLAFIPPPQNDDEMSTVGALRAASIALVVVTGNSDFAVGVPGLDGVPVVVKPFSETDLLVACESAILLQQIGYFR